MEKTSQPVGRQWPKWLFSGLTTALMVASWSLYGWVKNYESEIGRGWEPPEEVVDSFRQAEYISIRALPFLRIVLLLDVMALLALIFRVPHGFQNDLIVLGLVLGLCICVHGFDFLCASIFASQPNQQN